jgi:gamma-glutamyltranspeptidase/glutathione hydrolase
VVATSQPLAAQAGLAMLAAGGNAVDAALGDGDHADTRRAGVERYRLGRVRDPLGRQAAPRPERVRALPAGWTPEFFGGKGVPVRGWNSVTVPGCVSAVAHALGALRQAAVRKALRARDRLRAQRLSRLADDRRAVGEAGAGAQGAAGFAEAFMPGGRAPAPGERFRFPDHAATLEKIAATKGEAFYRGELAEKIETHSKRQDGVMRVSDLAAHVSDWITPLEIGYRGYTIHELPPNGQGIVALMALGMLSEFDVRSLPVDSADSVHLQIEAVKLAFADAFAYVADLEHMPFPPQQLLDRAYLRDRAKRST